MIEILLLIFKLVFTLIIILGLIYLSLRLSSEKINKYNENKYIKILEKTQISKDSSLIVVKVGKKGYVLSTTNTNIEKLDELSNEEILSLEEYKKKEKENLEFKYKEVLEKVKSFTKAKE